MGYLLDVYKTHHNLVGGYNLLFRLCSFSYLLAWGLMHLLAPTTPPVPLRPELARVLA